MIKGIIFMHTSGIPILIREVNPNFFQKLKILERKHGSLEGSQKGSLVSSLFAALTDFIKETFRRNIDTLIMEDLKITIKRSKDYIFVLVSSLDYRDPKKKIEKIMERIQSLNIDPEMLDIDQETRTKITAVIEQEIFGNRPNLEELFSAFDQILKEKIWDQKDNLNILKMPKNEISLNAIFYPSAKTVTLEEVIDDLYKGHLWDALVKSRNLKNLPSENTNTFLTVAIGLFLRTMDPKIPTVPLTELRKITKSLKNETLREMLSSHIDLFDKIGVWKNLNEIDICKLREIEQLEQKDRTARALYDALSLLRFMFGLISEDELDRKIVKSDNFRALKLIYLNLEKFLSTSKMSKEKYINRLNFYQQKIKRIYEIPILELIDYIYHVLEGMKIEELDSEYRANALEKLLDPRIQRRVKDILDSDNISNAVKGFIIYPIATAFTYLIRLHGHDRSYVEEHSNVINLIDKSIAYFVNVIENKRDTRLNLQLYLSAILAAYTSYRIPTGRPSFEIIGVIRNLLSDNIEDLYILQPNLCLEIIHNYVIILKNLISLIKDNVIKKILEEKINKIMGDIEEDIECLPAIKIRTRTVGLI
ncbi:MAG: hypothetical protein ACP6IP_03055 [Candidatus Njordarchaeia archaeon]